MNPFEQHNLTPSDQDSSSEIATPSYTQVETQKNVDAISFLENMHAQLKSDFDKSQTDFQRKYTDGRNQLNSNVSQLCAILTKEREDEMTGQIDMWNAYSGGVKEVIFKKEKIIKIVEGQKRKHL